MLGKTFLLVFLNISCSLLSMDYNAISFNLLPPEAQELVFEHAMIAEPYAASINKCAYEHK